MIKKLSEPTLTKRVIRVKVVCRKVFKTYSQLLIFQSQEIENPAVMPLSQQENIAA